MLSLYDSALSEAQLLHSREEGCPQRADDGVFFSIFRKTAGRPSQKSYRMPQLEAVVNATAGRDDIYISQSSFWSMGRRMVNFKQTRAAWVDLDIYNIGRKLDSATVAQILVHGEQLGIPAPTAVISSGRGCYLKWIFETPVSQSQLLIWQALQATLTAAYSSLAADFKARDASRVFRLLDTRNSKSGESVGVIEGSGRLYDFGAMCKALEALRCDALVLQTQSQLTGLSRKASVLTKSLAESADRGDIDALQLYSELNRPIMMEQMSVRSLNWTRFCDLRDVYAVRGGIPVGERDNAMFWMLNFLAQAEVVRSENWEHEVTELLRAFPQQNSFTPLTDGSMSTLLQRVKDKENGLRRTWRGKPVTPLYRPSNAFLIETFAIQPEEMSALGTIISPTEKQNRLDTKVAGRADRRFERDRWRAEVREAHAAYEDEKKTNPDAQRVKTTALATYLGIERTRVSRYWAELTKLAEQGAAPSPAAKILAKKVPTGEQATVVDRLVELAHAKAIETKVAVQELALQGNQAGQRERWANRKIMDLMVPGLPAQMDNKESEMATQDLLKKMHLLNAAGGSVQIPQSAQGLAPQSLPIKPAAGPVIQEPHEPAPKEAPWEDGSTGVSLTLDDVPSWLDEAPPLESIEAQSVGNPQTRTAHQQQDAMPPQGAIRKQQGTPAERLAAAIASQKRRDFGTRPRPAIVASEPVLPTTVASPKVPPVIRTQVPVESGYASPTDRLRRVAERVAKLPPLTKESRLATNSAPLVEGGPVCPIGYPKSDVWPTDVVAPGSKYSAEEWDQARLDAEGNTYAVIEMQTPDNSWFVRLLKPKLSERRAVVNGELTTISERVYPPGFKNGGSIQMLGMIYSDCIMVSKRSFPDFPGAAEAECDFGGAMYKVIRPRLDYLDPDRAFRVNAMFKAPAPLDLGFSLNEPEQLQDEAPSPGPSGG